VNGGFRERRKPPAKFLFARLLIFDAAISPRLRLWRTEKMAPSANPTPKVLLGHRETVFRPSSV
jgi:hypothetical protein